MYWKHLNNVTIVKRYGLFFLMLWTFVVKAQEDEFTYTNFIEKPSLAINSKLKVADPFIKDAYTQSPAPIIHYYTKVALVYGREQQTDLSGSSWSYEVSFKIEYKDQNSKLVKSSNKEYTIKINPDGTAVYESAKIFADNYGNVTITVTDIKKPTGTAPADIRLELSLTGKRTDQVDPNAPPELRWDDLNKLVYWSYMPQAQRYELEWVYVDKYDRNPVHVSNNNDVYPSLSLSTNEAPFLHKEPVRIVTAENSFFPNFSLPEGTVYFRVRGVGNYIGASNQSQMVSDWSYGYSTTPLSLETSSFEKNMLWQYVTTFAEEGKYKKVLSHYDGTMRTRQTATNLSSDKTILMAETKYDFEGRGALQVMPTVISGTDLKYEPNLNPFANQNVGKRYHNLQGTAEPLENSSTALHSAARYYSSGNTVENLNRDYLPDAEQYPYSETEYLADNSGRIKRQSGVGATFKLQHPDNGTHYTRYFYGNTNKAELTRLFGAKNFSGKNLSEGVGEAKHYSKDMIVDPNGQVSISYKDMQGRVIASCLSGNSPDNVQSLNATPTNITVNLMDDNVLDKGTGISKSVTKLLKTSEPSQVYTFLYTISPVINKLGTYCKSCTYSVRFTVLDPEGNDKTPTEHKGIWHSVAPTTTPVCSTAAQTYTYASIPFSATFNEIGTYTIIKELKLDGGAIHLTETEIDALVTDGIFQASEVPDYDKLLQDYTAEAVEKAAQMCDVSCEQRARTAKGSNATDAEIQQWIKQYCDPATTTEEMQEDECASILEQMKEQLSPGGIYNVTNPVTNVSWLDNKLGNISMAVWRKALSIEAGQPDPSLPSLADIQDEFKFREAWANALVSIHPEYCHYQFCQMEKKASAADKKRAMVKNWAEVGVTTASQQENYDIVTGDYIFEYYHDPVLPDALTESQVSSLNATIKNSLTTRIASYFIEPVTTSPVAPENEWNGNGIPGETISLQKFVLSKKLFIEKDLPEAQVPAPTFENPRTWQYFVGIYSGLKTRKMAEARKNICPYLTSENAVVVTPLQAGINDTDDPAIIKASVDNYNTQELDKHCSEEVLLQVVDMWIGTLKSQCNIGTRLSISQLGNLRSKLFLYAQSNCGVYNAANVMFEEDLMTSADLIDAQTILNTLNTGCSLHILAMRNKPCITKEILLEKRIDPLAQVYLDLINDYITVTMPVGATEFNVFNNVGGTGPIVDLFTLPSYETNWSFINDQKHFVPVGQNYIGQTNGILGWKTGTGNPNNDDTGVFMFLLNKETSAAGTGVLMIVPRIFSWDIRSVKKFFNLRINPIPNAQYATLVDILFMDNTVLTGETVAYANTNPGTGPLSLLSWEQIYDIKNNVIRPIVTGQNTTIKVCDNDPHDNCHNLKKLTLDVLPSLAATQRAWRIYNPNPVSVKADWYVNSNEKGSMTIKGNSLAYLVTAATGASDVQPLKLSVKMTSLTPTEHVSLASGYQPAKVVVEGFFTENYLTERLWRFYNPYDKDVYVSWTFGTQSGKHLAKAGKDTYLSTPLAASSNTSFQVSFAGSGITQADVNCGQVSGTPSYMEYEDPTNRYCDLANPWDPELEKQSCLDELLQQAQADAGEEYERQMQSFLSKFMDAHSNKCFDNPFTEKFTASYELYEHHYTLYYYDQAGNLVQTVPPAGVDIQPVNSNGEVTTEPQHGLRTQYKYNSLQQLIYQITPDAGETRFFYNSAGQLRLSQNEQQALESAVSYTRYDSYGRVVETGKMHFPSSYLLPENAQTLSKLLDDPIFPIAYTIEGYTLSFEEVTYTAYDQPLATESGFVQENLRNRVAASYVMNDRSLFPKYNSATFYSYDVHGNVKDLLQKVDCNQETGVCQLSKSVRYQYDLISGKVNQVEYQPGQPDRFLHRYRYDADNRLVSVKTSADGYIWEEDARYFYYKHGPLARVELGEDKVQGLDYYYTLQGWLKGINTPATRDANQRVVQDLGKDGFSTSSNLNKYIAQDEYALALGYHDKDYTAIGATTPTSLGLASANSWTNTQLGTNILNYGTGKKGLYNGNIAYTIQQVHKLGETTDSKSLLGYAYQYDQLHRIKAGYAYLNTAGTWTRTSNDINKSAYDVRYDYDPNGNIKRAQVNNTSGSQLMDDLTYKYDEETINGETRVTSNKLNYVTDTYDEYQVPDITNQETSNYQYDRIGNLIFDRSENILYIDWTLYGKVKAVRHYSNWQSADKEDLEFKYDAMGNRVVKISKPLNTSGAVEPSDQWKYTYYLRDASGNVMQVINKNPSTDPTPVTTEYPVYGSARLGRFKSTDKNSITTLSGEAYDLPKYTGASSQSLTSPTVYSYSVVNGKTLFVPAEQTLYGTTINLAQGSTLVISGTLAGNCVVNTNGAATIWVLPEGTWNGTNVTLQNGALLRNMGALFLSDYLKVKAPSTFENTGTLFSLSSTEEGGVYNRAGDWIVAGSTKQRVVMKEDGTVSYNSVDALSFVTDIQRRPSKKEYEVTDHLGNVMATLTGLKSGFRSSGTTGGADYYKADITSAHNYYPFGFEMQGERSLNNGYRYGFNGKEKDPDGLGGGGSTYDYGFRIYNPALGKFLSVDPLSPQYPWYTPYQFAGNTPIMAVDIDGLEPGFHAILAAQKNGDAQLAVKATEGDKKAMGAMRSLNKASMVHSLIALSASSTAVGGVYVLNNWVNLLYNPIVQSEILAAAAGLAGYDGNDMPGQLDDVVRSGKILFRGDSRKTVDIFKEGFKAKGKNTDLMEYVETNAPSIFIGTTKSTEEAAKKANGGFVYVIDNANQKGTDVNNFYKAMGDFNPHAKEQEVVFDDLINPEQIQGAYPVNDKGEIMGNFIQNPNYKPVKKQD